MKATQAAVDAALPETVNRIECQRCIGVPTVLVTASSDRQPPRYYVYNRDTKVLTSIAGSRPWIEPRDMGKREYRRFTARDGMSIPVLVTHPPGKASGPGRPSCWCMAARGCGERIGNGRRTRSFSHRAATS